MALRTMSYDVSEYEHQAAVLRKKIRKRKGLTRGEFLSGFTKDSQLHPCVTLVLFYVEEWDGSRDLYGIMDFTDMPDELKGMVNNYRLNLLEIRKLANTEVYKTDLKQVFDFIRCSKDKETLVQLVKGDAAYAKMEEDAYDVAVAFTKAEQLIDVKKFHENGGKVNMCEALNELLKDSREAGKIEGKIEGKTEGCEEERQRFLKLIQVMVLNGESDRIAELSDNEELLKEMYEKYHLL